MATEKPPLSCKKTDFKVTTYGDLVLYAISLDKDLKICSSIVEFYNNKNKIESKDKVNGI